MQVGTEILSADIPLRQKDGSAVKLTGVKVGDLIRAKVLDLLPDGRAHLRVAGQNVIVKASYPMAKGDNLILELIRQGEPPVFKPAAQSSLTVMPGQQGDLKSLAALFSKATFHLESVAAINDPGVKTILENLALKSGKRDEGLLVRLIENLGLTLEKKMAAMAVSKGLPMDGNRLSDTPAHVLKTDLKAAVLNLLSRDSGSDGANLLKSASAAIESFQQINTQSFDGNRFLLPFPILAPGFLEFGQLFINTGDRSGKGNQKKDRVIDVAFLMNMTALGKIRADFAFYKKNITGGFLLENQSICDYMRTLMPELKSRLGSIGFNAGHIGCQVAPASSFSLGGLAKAMSGSGSDDSRALDLVI
ncbi:MAG: hypothetical protein CSA29_04380 [Desulfobacterales bacterium]|nr:MAG: hypothetical protein CSA29_04380 [Desulfobacterales bacterium]